MRPLVTLLRWPRLALWLGPVLLIGLLPTVAAAQDLSYKVSVDSSQVRAGQPFRITCEIESQGGAIEDLELPDLGGLIQLGQSRSEGSQVSVVNGQLSMSRRVTVSLTVQADSAGTYKIGPGQVSGGGQQAKSRAFVITAVDSGGSASGTAQPGQGSSPRGSAGARFASPQPGSDPDQGAQNQAQGKNSKLFVNVELDRDRAYLGQQIVATVYLYSRTQLSDIRGMQLPDFSGVVIEDLESPRRVNGQRVHIAGRRYQRYMLRRMALFPTQVGALQIPSASVDAVVGGGFFNRGRVYQLHSDPLDVEVMDLPSEGQPADFNPGNVGDYALEVQVDNRQISVDDPLTLRVSVSGQGNLRSVVLPSLPKLEQARLYPPSPSEEIQTTATGVQGHKSYEILVQALAPGRLRIPGLRFAFFDPLRGRYHVGQSKPIDVEVSPGKQAGNSAAATPIEGRAAPLNARPVHLQPRCEERATGLSSQRFVDLVLALGLSFLALLVLTPLWGRRQVSLQRLARQARQRARQRVLQLAGASPLDVDATARSVDEYLELCLKQAVKGLTRDQLQALLQTQGFGAAERGAVEAFYVAAEARRFAPLGAAQGSGCAARVQAVVDAIDKHLANGKEAS